MHNFLNVLRKCTVSGWAAAVLLALASPLAAQVDLGLSPMRVEFPAVAGRPYSGSLILTNAGTERGRVRTELLDLYVDENTTPQFVPNAPAEAAHSCRSWLSVNPMELEIQPRSQVSIRFTVRMPETVSERSYHCAIGFRTLPAPGEQVETSMRTAVRLIAAIYPIVGKPPIHGEIKGLNLEPVVNDSTVAWRAVATLENSGLMLYRPSGTVEVLDTGGKVIESQKIASFPVLPQRQQRFVLPIKSALSPGQYTLRARIEVGAEIQEASAAVVVEAPRPATAAAAAEAK